MNLELIEPIIAGRRSVRGFLPKAVPEDTLTKIFELAARAPSGTNMQPWKVYVAQGDVRDKLCEAVSNDFQSGVEISAEYQYYPDNFREPYLSRRRKIGLDLYGILGIRKGEKVAMKLQHKKNFEFFGAPVGIICTIDKDLALGSWLDYGMFLGNLMTAARGAGLETCCQAAWANYPETIRRILDIPQEEAIVCGVSLGYEDVDEPANRLRTVREAAEGWVNYRGYA